MVERNSYTDRVLQYAHQQEPLIDKGAELLSFTAQYWSEELIDRVLQLLVAGEFAEVRSLRTERPASMAKFREDLVVLEVLDRQGKIRWVLVYDNDELWQDPEVLVIV
jgi:hypothetical protein